MFLFSGDGSVNRVSCHESRDQLPCTYISRLSSEALLLRCELTDIRIWYPVFRGWYEMSAIKKFMASSTYCMTSLMHRVSESTLLGMVGDPHVLELR